MGVFSQFVTLITRSPKSFLHRLSMHNVELMNPIHTLSQSNKLCRGKSNGSAMSRRFVGVQKNLALSSACQLSVTNKLPLSLFYLRLFCMTVSVFNIPTDKISARDQIKRANASALAYDS